MNVIYIIYSDYQLQLRGYEVPKAISQYNVIPTKAGIQ
jgi:hypothetical protein